MTLTLEEVSRIRFPMARRPGEGYRAGEVDDFVDKVDLTFRTMTEEKERLQSQLEALKADGGQGQAHDSGEADAALRDENEQLRRELDAARAAAQQAPVEGDDSSAELQRLREENAGLQSQIGDLNRELQQAREDRTQVQPAVTEAPAAPAVEQGESKFERIVVSTSAEASPQVVRLVQLATDQAESVVKEAEAEAKRKREEAEQAASQTTQDAAARAEQIEAEARANAEQVRRDAEATAAQVEADAKSRRTELISHLEQERDEFAGKVEKLRSWESSYRSNLTSHLRKQADALESDQFEPGDAPGLLGEEGTKSPTPRLDALLAEKQ